MKKGVNCIHWRIDWVEKEDGFASTDIMKMACIPKICIPTSYLSSSTNRHASVIIPIVI